jgi:methionyl-tRNA formyltransferase
MFDIGERDTGLSVSTKCIREGLALIEKLLETAASDPCSIPSIPQDFTRRQYFGKGVPNGGKISWSDPARQVHNFVRAADFSPLSSPWNPPVATLEDLTVGILRAELTGEKCAVPPGTIGKIVGTGVYVACADEWLNVRTVLLDGRHLEAASVLSSGVVLASGTP